MSDYDDFQEPDLDELLGTGLDDDLFQAAFGANQNVTEVTARHEPTPAPPPPVPLHPSIPACIHCGKAAMSNDVTRTFGLQICRLCSKGPRYQLIAKTRAKETYLLTDEDFDGKLKYIMRENPNKAGWSTMHLFLLSEVEALAIDKHGSLEEITERKQQREVNRLDLRMKRRQREMEDEQMLEELRKEYMANQWISNRDKKQGRSEDDIEILLRDQLRAKKQLIKRTQERKEKLLAKKRKLEEAEQGEGDEESDKDASKGRKKIKTTESEDKDGKGGGSHDDGAIISVRGISLESILGGDDDYDNEDNADFKDLGRDIGLGISRTLPKTAAISSGATRTGGANPSEEKKTIGNDGGDSGNEDEEEEQNQTKKASRSKAKTGAKQKQTTKATKGKAGGMGGLGGTATIHTHAYKPVPNTTIERCSCGAEITYEEI